MARIGRSQPLHSILLSKAVYDLGNIQLLPPIADISVGAWSPSVGTTLFGVIDESPYDDSDYISTSSVTTCEVSFTNSAGDPNLDTDHIIRFRARNSGSGSMIVYLYEGTTQIASYVPVLTSGFQTYTWTLSNAEAASITNYGNLRIRFAAS